MQLVLLWHLRHLLWMFGARWTDLLSVHRHPLSILGRAGGTLPPCWEISGCAHNRRSTRKRWELPKQASSSYSSLRLRNVPLLSPSPDAPYLPKKAFSLLSRHRPDCEPCSPGAPGAHIRILCCLFCFVFIFPAHWKKGLFLFKRNFGSENLFRLSPALPPCKPSGVCRENSESLLRNTVLTQSRDHPFLRH